MYLGPSLTKGSLLAPWLAAWLPNIVLGLVGILLFAGATASPIGRLRIPLPALLAAARDGHGPWTQHAVPADGHPRPLRGVTYAARARACRPSPWPAIFYISTFTRSLRTRCSRATRRGRCWARSSSIRTPQYVYYIIPLAVLLAALVTIGVLTKNNELVVMKACGISLYRVALPMVVCAVLAGALALRPRGDACSGPPTGAPKSIRHVMRGGSPETFDVAQPPVGRRHAMARSTTTHYFDPQTPALHRTLGLRVQRRHDAT